MAEGDPPPKDAAEETGLEEEDLFEDFALINGTDDVDLEGEKEMPLWEADWDDEDQGTDFAQKLKAELAKASSQMEAT